MANQRHDLNHKLSVLFPIITAFKGKNCVIGGGTALRLHGLKMSRPANDLDIIIFEPTAIQLKVLQTLRPFDLIKDSDRPDYTEADSMDGIRAMKFKRKDLYLDIVLADELLPDDLMEIETNEGCFFVNSVDRIVAAKVSYTWEQKKQDQLHTFMRSKDLTDLLDLKNSNFNV